MVTSINRPWTKDQIKNSFVQDEEGNLLWIVGPRKNKIAGWKDKDGYTLLRYKNILVRSHNLIWLMHKGIWPDKEIDHIDNNPLNNKICNLRLTTRKENCSNQKLQNRRVGQFKGVFKNISSFYVKIKHEGKQNYLGSFKSEYEAAFIYNLKAKELFGKFANYNRVFEDVDAEALTFDLDTFTLSPTAKGF